MKSPRQDDNREPAQSGMAENQKKKLQTEGKKVLKWRENAEAIR